MELVGTTALVAGGSKGIGYAEADYLMAQGADVAITSRKQDEITAAATALTQAHPGRWSARADGVVRPQVSVDDARIALAAIASFRVVPAERAGTDQPVYAPGRVSHRSTGQQSPRLTFTLES